MVKKTEIIAEKVEALSDNLKNINWKKIIIITSISLFILIIILFFTGLNIRFAAKDDLLLFLDPSEKSFRILNYESQDVTFSITNRNSILCMAECEYVLYDRSEGKQLLNGTFSLRNKNQFSKSYTFTPYSSGSGQRIYSFEVSCKNIKSVVCRTSSPLRRRTAFITLNYELSEEEKELKNNLRPKIITALQEINEANVLINKSGSIKDIKKIILPNNYRELREQSSTLLNSSISIAENSVGFWENEDYIQLEKVYIGSLQPQVLSLDSKSKELYNLTVSSIEQQNLLIDEYNQHLNEAGLILNSKKAQFINHDKLMDASEETKYLLVKINQYNYSNILGLYEDMIYLNERISNLSMFIDDAYEKSLDNASSLFKKELEKKCYLGYCENRTEELCTLFSDILTEFSQSSYEIPGNLSIGNQSYYQKINDTSLIIIPEQESQDFFNNNCKNNSEQINLSLDPVQKINISFLNSYVITDIITSNISENPPLCCVQGKCTPCCTEDSCQDNPSLYPIVFIHGHSLLRETSPEPLADGFNKIQYALQDDGYLNAGTLLFDFDINVSRKNEWGLANTPISVKASYYYDYFYSIGSYVYLTRSGENIDTYAIRLNDIIDLVKYKTGKGKVNIIAHSMGGLVARRYLQIFEKDTINKLILIGTPNKGIVGDVKDFCHIFGEKRECEDMYNDSIFIKKLNSPIVEKPKADIYTISGKGCKTAGKDGDGVVVFENSLLDQAVSYVVVGNCTDAFGKSLHVDMLDIDLYPETYSYVSETLNLG
jgi:hypothetical protein